jgi:hypothetical protein
LGVRAALHTLVLVLIILLISQIAQARCFGVPSEDQEPVIPWYVHLDIRTSNEYRRELEFGVGPGLTDGFESGVDEYVLQDPEEPLQAYLLYPDAGGPFSRLRKSFTSFTEKVSWLLQIVYKGENTTLEITWDVQQTRALPGDVGLLLMSPRDDQIDMKSTNGVSLQISAGVHNLRILAFKAEGDADNLAWILLAYGAAVAILILFVRRRRRGS